MKYPVLGHLVHHRDYGYRLTAELAERLELPELRRSTVYQALARLEEDGLIREVGRTSAVGSGRDRVWYEATEKGEQHFEGWLRNASEVTAPQDELHRKLLVSQPGNLPELIDLTWEQERACLARLGDLERAVRAPAEQQRQSWSWMAAVLVRNNQIAHLQTTVRSLQRAREVMVRLREDPHRQPRSS